MENSRSLNLTTWYGRESILSFPPQPLLQHKNLLSKSGMEI